MSDTSELLVVFDLRIGWRHDSTFDKENAWTIVPRRIQMPVIRSKIGEVGRVGRVSRESARLNGKTRASGISSFSCSLFFSFFSYSSMSLSLPPFLTSRLEYDIGNVETGDLRNAGVDEEVQTTSESLSDLEQISISSAYPIVTTLWVD